MTMQKRSLCTSILILCCLWAVDCSSLQADTDLPKEPVEIGHRTQFFVDDYIVDNRWALKKREEFLVRKVHQPVKHPANPVIPGRGGYVNVVWDDDAKLYRMLYQDFWYYSKDPVKYTYAIAYAESKDGLKWDTPNLAFYKWKNTRQNNICWQVPSDRDAPVTTGAYSQYLLTIPKEHRPAMAWAFSFARCRHFPVGSGSQQIAAFRVPFAAPDAARYAESLPLGHLSRSLAGFRQDRKTLIASGAALRLLGRGINDRRYPLSA